MRKMRPHIFVDCSCLRNRTDNRLTPPRLIGCEYSVVFRKHRAFDMRVIRVECSNLNHDVSSGDRLPARSVCCSSSGVTSNV